MVLNAFGDTDLHNRLGNRDEFNTNQFEYNCGGWALKTFNWYLPYGAYDADYSDDSRQDFFRECAEGIDLDSLSGMDIFYEKVLKEDTNYMLKDFEDEGLKLVENPEDLSPMKNLIAYRVVVYPQYNCDGNIEFFDADFHYMVREDGVWTSKCGDGEI